MIYNRPVQPFGDQDTGSGCVHECRREPAGAWRVADRLCYSEFRASIGLGADVSCPMGRDHGFCDELLCHDGSGRAVHLEKVLFLGYPQLSDHRPRAVCCWPSPVQRQRAGNRRRPWRRRADKVPSGDLLSPWFIILNSPDDLAAFWKSIDRPDLVVIKADQLPLSGPRSGSESKRAAASPWLVESVQVHGEVTEDFANLKVELQVVVKGSASVWVPIRLDRREPARCARRGARAGFAPGRFGRMASFARARRRAPNPGRVAGAAGRRAGSQVTVTGHSRSGLDRRRPRVFAGRVRHRRGSQRGLRAT